MAEDDAAEPLFAKADGTGLPRRPHGSGDRWVEGPDGRRFWGAFGAAGLLVHHPAAGVLLQHRVEWSHFGGTWGLPGGARHEHESAPAGAIREANEEAGVPEHDLGLHFSAVLDLGWWSYTTVAARARRRFAPRIGDAESLELRWVPVDEVDALPLHPGFEASWPALRPELTRDAVLIVDSANVVGSRPDGWWNDRAGATERLAGRLSRIAADGVPAALLGLAHDRWWPRVSVVVEGQAKAAEWSDESVTRIAAEHDGDSRIVAEASREVAAGASVTVVTADRALADAVRGVGANVAGPGALLDAISE
jgi:8-oxo-dGTP diphosphatase